jgi:acyl-coenzyme A synthetase/AMP-(fatty) acid ligase
MPPLSHRLPEIEDGADIWCSPTLGRITGKELRLVLSAIDSGVYRGRRVAIGVMPAVELLATLVFLDGVAETIIILPPEEEPEARARRLSGCAVDHLLEDGGVGFVKGLLALRSSVGAEVAEEKAVSLEKAHGTSSLPTSWLLPTSGTTGVSKLIPHTSETLTRGMAGRRSCSDFIWGSLYSFWRFAGLQVFLQSWTSMTTLIVCDEAEGFDRRVEWLASLGCSALSATPSMWRKLAMWPEFNRFALKQITLGGEIADQPVLDMLRRRFPSARITHVYASTEAGVGLSVKDGMAGFPVSFLKEPPGDVRLAISAEGHLLLRPPSSDGSADQEENEWTDSGDVVQVRGDRVMFLGRANGSINVGGDKVMPDEVESVIRELPEVVFVQVRAKRSSIVGNMVEAAVRLGSGAALTQEMKKKIVGHCRTRLEAFKVPSVVVGLEEITLTSSGKLSRTKL